MNTLILAFVTFNHNTVGRIVNRDKSQYFTAEHCQFITMATKSLILVFKTKKQNKKTTQHTNRPNNTRTHTSYMRSVCPKLCIIQQVAPIGLRRGSTSLWFCPGQGLGGFSVLLGGVRIGPAATGDSWPALLSEIIHSWAILCRKKQFHVSN